MVEDGKHYFLSRPRRFGKSLFLDTLKELFEGNEPLFEGLSIHDHWDWSVRHPVVRLDFGSGRPQGSRRSCPAWIGMRCATGTTATGGSATSGSTTPSTSCCCSTGGSSLGYPNREVRQSLNESLLRRLTGRPASLAEHTARLYDLLAANDFRGLETLFRALFASIPYEWHTRNDIARYEGYYARCSTRASPRSAWTSPWRTASARPSGWRAKHLPRRAGRLRAGSSPTVPRLRLRSAPNQPCQESAPFYGADSWAPGAARS